jgi:hypothetical protein
MAHPDVRDVGEGLVEDLNLLGTRTLRALTKAELDVIAFNKATIASCGTMYKDIVASVIRRNEPEALGRIVALDNAGHDRKRGNINR